MHVNPIYKKIGKERRQYRKYAPWIFFGAELVLVGEILYTLDLVVGISNIIIIIALGIAYVRLNKLFHVLDRQKPLKESGFHLKQFNKRKIK